MGKGTDNDHARDAKAHQDTKQHDQGHDSNPKATSSAQADKMVAQNLSPSQPSFDFGERIIGSDTTEQIAAPWNLRNVPAIARFVVSGGDFALASSDNMTLNPSGTMAGEDLTYQQRAAPKVLYTPSKGGAQQGVLTIVVAWQDGHSEVQTISLHGRAKSLDQAASHTETAAEVADEQQTQKRLADEQKQQEGAVAADAKQKPVYSPEFDSAVEDAAFAAGMLARHQRDGVELIDKETKAYQKVAEKAPHSIWGDLLEIALTMATAGVAAHLAKVLLPKLLGTTVEKVEDIAIAGHPEMVTKEFIPAKFSEFTTDFMKEGIKQVGKKAIAAIPHESGGGGASTSHAPVGEQASTNPEISFFSQQWKILEKQETGNHELVKKHAGFARTMLRTQPKQAVATMNRLKESFDETGEQAELDTANQLAPQWATLISRLSLGTEKTNTADGKNEQDALQTEKLRDRSGSGAPKPVDGVLDVYLDGDYTEPRLEGAKLYGVSQEIADRLAGLPIANLPMPVRFVLGPRNDKPTIITRDEAGRVRVVGTLHGTDREQNEVAYAQKLIERFLSTPLSAANLEIQSNDATGRR